MGYGGFKDLPTRMTFDKVLRDKAFNIVQNSKYDGYQRSLDSMVYKFFEKDSAATHRGATINSKNEQLGDELSKPVIRKFEKT